MQKRLITVADIRQASSSGKKSLLVPSDECIVTPMAVDEAIALDLILNDEPNTTTGFCGCPPAPSVTEPDVLVQTVSQLLKARGASNVSAQKLESVVRDVVAKKMATAPAKPSSPKAAPDVGKNKGIRFIKAERLLEEGGALTTVPEKMIVASAVDGASGKKLAGGYMAWENARFSRCVETPEIAVVIEGELHLITGGETLVGTPGDMIYLPKGATVDYHSPGKVKLACINCV